MIGMRVGFNPLLSAAVIGAIGVALVGFAFFAVYQHHVATARLEFQQAADAIDDDVVHYTSRPIELVRSIAAHALVSERITEDGLRRFVSELASGFPAAVVGVVGVERASPGVLVRAEADGPAVASLTAELSEACAGPERGTGLRAELRSDAKGGRWVGLLLRPTREARHCAVVVGPSGYGVDLAFRNAKSARLHGYLFLPGAGSELWGCFTSGVGRTPCDDWVVDRTAIADRYWLVWDGGPIAATRNAPLLVVTPRDPFAPLALLPNSTWAMLVLGLVAAFGIAGLRYRIVAARAALAQREARYQRLIADSPVAFVGWSADGRVVEWNPAAERLFGTSRAAALGRPVQDLLRCADGSLLPVSDSPTGDFVQQEILRSDGSRFWAEALVRTIETDDGPHFMAFVRDFGAQRAALEARRQAERVVGAAELANGFAHDFNNLLTVVTGSLELVASAVADDPEASADLEAARRAAQHGAEMVRAMHALSRRKEIVPARIELDRELSRLGPDLQRVAGAEVHVSTAPGAHGAWIEVDLALLSSALINLVLNSRHAMPGGGAVQVRTRVEEVGPHAGTASLDAGSYAVIEVVDDGPGMAPGVAARAFEPFFSTRPDDSGTGLGLSMVRGFAQRFGGDAVIETAPGEGTTVRVFLALAKGA